MFWIDMERRIVQNKTGKIKLNEKKKKKLYVWDKNEIKNNVQNSHLRCSMKVLYVLLGNFRNWFFYIEKYAQIKMKGLYNFFFLAIAKPIFDGVFDEDKKRIEKFIKLSIKWKV